MIGRLERIAQGLLEPINIYAGSIVGALTLFWGFWVINPWWKVFDSAPVFSRAQEFAPEWAWGTWSVSCGIIILVALVAGYHKQMVFALGFAIWHWSTIAIMCWWGDWQNTAGVTYSFIALWVTYAWLNLKINRIRYPTGTF